MNALAGHLSGSEHLIRSFPAHWIRFVKPAIIWVLLTGASVLLYLLAGIAAHHYPVITDVSFVAALALMIFTTHWFFFVLLSESASFIAVTNKRIIWVEEKLFLEDRMVEVSFERTNTVDVEKQGMLQNLLRYGTLRFETGMRIPYVPHPNSVARDLEQAVGLR